MVVNLQVVEVAKELKESGHQDIALQLLKIHDRQLDIERDAVGYYTIKMEIMQILIDKVRIRTFWTLM